jgi:DNA-3-methyladenine glycosylase
MSGVLLGGKQINILDDGFIVPKNSIGISERIGVDYAGEDALLKYRFYIKGNPFVSGKVK